MFEKDTIWDSFTGCETLESFKKRLPLVFIHQDAEDGIKKELLILRRLLEHAYSEYSFSDVALVQGMFIFEKACKNFYSKDINNNYPNFYKMTKHLYETGYFEVSNRQIIDQLRDIRNHKAHEKHSVMGIVGFTKLRIAINLLNDLYRDKKLRQERNTLRNNIVSRLNENKNGFELSIDNSNSKSIIYDWGILFIDNTLEQYLYHIFMLPIFDLKQIDSDWGPYFYFTCSDFSFDEKTLIITGTDIKTGKIFRFSPIQDSFIQSLLKTWGNDFKSNEGLINIKLTNGMRADEIFNNIWREFLMRDAEIIE